MGWDKGASHEQPAHKVTFTRPLYLGVYEVSQSVFQRIMGSNPSYARGTNWPVNWIRWSNAVEFCSRLTELEHASGWLPANMAYRLPTEAEWEYAARAGSTNRFWFGDEAASLGNHDWFKGNSDGRPNGVGTKLPNPWGLYDMHGGVCEWCSDWYGPYDAKDAVDPNGTATGTGHFFRRGGWMDEAADCRASERGSAAPDQVFMDRGFRVALSSIR